MERQQKYPGTATRMTFGPAEAAVSEWMAEHARVVWMTTDNPWDVEDELIETLDLPLNLKGNAHNDFYPKLRSARMLATEVPSIDASLSYRSGRCLPRTRFMTIASGLSRISLTEPATASSMR
ncbi:MAG: hypothetical protein LC808_37565 [Actinobacteria bacterium]|nr:hypothetical protein [Actinomycetota bacterium]